MCTFYWFCSGIKIVLRWFKMRPWKEMPLGKLTLAKTWGKKENFNDNLYIEEGLFLESSL